MTPTIEAAVVAYQPCLKPHFARLNREWLEKYFAVEPFDEALFDDPEGLIIAPGGCILFYQDCQSSEDGDIVGTGALIKRADGVYELAKMAVTDKYQGRGFGKKLMAALIEQARVLGAHTVELGSNRLLEPAIAMYRAFGFEEVPISPEYMEKYARCNIKMRLKLG